MRSKRKVAKKKNKKMSTRIKKKMSNRIKKKIGGTQQCENCINLEIQPVREAYQPNVFMCRHNLCKECILFTILNTQYLNYLECPLCRTYKNEDEMYKFILNELSSVDRSLLPFYRIIGNGNNSIKLIFLIELNRRDREIQNNRNPFAHDGNYQLRELKNFMFYMFIIFLISIFPFTIVIYENTIKTVNNLTEFIDICLQILNELLRIEINGGGQETLTEKSYTLENNPTEEKTEQEMEKIIQPTREQFILSTIEINNLKITYTKLNELYELFISIVDNNGSLNQFLQSEKIDVDGLIVELQNLAKKHKNFLTI